MPHLFPDASKNQKNFEENGESSFFSVSFYLKMHKRSRLQLDVSAKLVEAFKATQGDTPNEQFVQGLLHAHLRVTGVEKENHKLREQLRTEQLENQKLLVKGMKLGNQIRMLTSTTAVKVPTELCAKSTRKERRKGTTVVLNSVATIHGDSQKSQAIGLADYFIHH